jgi:hypothetical protein
MTEQKIAPQPPADKQNEPTTFRSIGELSSGLVRKAEFLPIGESLIDYDDEFGARK